MNMVAGCRLPVAARAEATGNWQRATIVQLAPNIRASQNTAAPMIAEAGMVSTQAQTMRPATPQRTADRRRVAPTPTIAPVMACVVDTGIPKCVAVKMAIAA